jgi:asparagine synthase (glutamine-hydrolysing)
MRRALGFVPSWLESPARVATRLPALFAPNFAADFAGRDPYRVFLNSLDVPRIPLDGSPGHVYD